MTTNKFKSLVVLVLTGILFTNSCSKSSTSSTSTTTGGTTTGGTTTTTCSFLPYKNGTKLKEKVNGTNYDFTLSDTLIKGNTYFKSTSNIPTGIGYVRQNSSGEVIQYIPAQELSSGIFIPELLTTMLKPSQNVGTTWVDSTSANVSGFRYTNIYTYKIVDKGFSTTILGTNYTNCMKVQLTVGSSIAGQYQAGPAINYFWACGFGFFKSTDASGSVVSEVTGLTL